MQPSQEVKQLTNKFGLKVKSMKPVHRGVYRIVSASGRYFCLKRMFYSPARLRWIDKMLLQLKERGFSRIAWRNPQIPEGRVLFVRLNRGSTPHVLNPWVEGRWPSPASMQDMRDCAVLLAQFHQAGHKCIPPKQGKLDMIGKWPSLFRMQFRVLKKKINKARHSGYGTPMDTLLNKYGDETMQRAEKAITILRNSDYRAACLAARKTGALCHGDGGPTNFIMNQKGMYLIDFETLRLDLRAYDLYRVIHNSCKDHKWNFDIARNILEGYQSVSPLNNTDYELLKVWLRFPRETIKLLSRYEHARNKAALEQQLVDLIKEDRIKTPFLDQLDRYYRKENEG